MKTLMLLALMAQFPQVPDKSPGIPSKTTPLASPQAALATPQQALAPQYDTPVVLQAAPRVYAIQRQVILQAAPVAYAPVASYALADTGCAVGVQANFIQHSAVIQHGFVHQAQINHQIGVGVGRQPRKVKTKQVTRVRRGLFGGRG